MLSSFFNFPLWLSHLIGLERSCLAGRRRSARVSAVKLSHTQLTDKKKMHRLKARHLELNLH